MRRSLVVVGLSSALLLGGATGMVLGNPLLSGAETAPAAAAAASGHGSHLADVLGPLVSDGTITQAQADKVVAALEAAHGAHGGMAGRDAMKAGLETAAKTLNMSTDDLRAALKSGKTLGQVADGAGVSRTTLVDALVAEARTRLDEAVTAGKLTQAEADARKADLSTRITERLDQTRPARPSGGHRRGHGPMRPGSGAGTGTGTSSSTGA